MNNHEIKESKELTPLHTNNLSPVNIVSVTQKMLPSYCNKLFFLLIFCHCLCSVIGFAPTITSTTTTVTTTATTIATASSGLLPPSHTSWTWSLRMIKPTHQQEENNHEAIHRRNFLSTLLTCTTLASSLAANADIEGVVTPSFSQGPPTPSIEQGVKLYTTKSGLKFIILKEAPSSTTAPTPRYGQLVTISYKSYVKLPNSDLQAFDSDKAFLIKHGNGRMIPGLDEGIHTMKLGETRRIIIPPKLGYIGPGVLGPLPSSPWGRYRLNRLLEQMVDARAGNIVMDVELKNILDDEADQGYYDDESISPEDFNTLRMNMSEKARRAREEKKIGDSAPLLDLP